MKSFVILIILFGLSFVDANYNKFENNELTNMSSDVVKKTISLEIFDKELDNRMLRGKKFMKSTKSKKTKKTKKAKKAKKAKRSKRSKRSKKSKKPKSIGVTWYTTTH